MESHDCPLCAALPPSSPCLPTSYSCPIPPIVPPLPCTPSHFHHTVLVISLLVGWYHAWLVPKGWPRSSPQLNVAMGMITTCLSLLLVFRTNSGCWGRGGVKGLGGLEGLGF